MICKTLSIAVLFVVLVVRPAGAGSVPSDAEAITAAMNGFHAQTREEYAREHLEEDIAFTKAVPGTRSKLSIKQEGNVAWTSATAQSIGTFNGRQVNGVGVELMVSTNSPAGWRIRAIHWSSHSVKKAN